MCLIFGGSSSVGIYDRFAKIVLFIVIVNSGIPPSLVVQQIDDVVACGPANGDLVEKFDKEYSRVADMLGIQLAPRDDPDKSFAAATRGRFWEFWYDSKNSILLNMVTLENLWENHKHHGHNST